MESWRVLLEEEVSLWAKIQGHYSALRKDCTTQLTSAIASIHHEYRGREETLK